MEANDIIDRLGGTSKTAELCAVTDQAVSQWRKDGIPEARLMYLRLARPDVFAKEKGSDRRHTAERRSNRRAG